jgi:hypothetical protein
MTAHAEGTQPPQWNRLMRQGWGFTHVKQTPAERATTLFWNHPYAAGLAGPAGFVRKNGTGLSKEPTDAKSKGGNLPRSPTPGAATARHHEAFRTYLWQRDVRNESDASMGLSAR